MHIVLYLLAGGTIGGLSGALGIGGGVLLVPLLMWLFKMDYARAAGTTLSILAVPVTFFGALESYRQDRVELQAAMWIALAFAGGCYLGARSVPNLNALHPDLLRFAFGLLIVYVGVRFVITSDITVAKTAAGLSAAASAWVVYIVLRRIGRKYLPKPAPLGEHIQSAKEPPSEYYI